MKPEINDEFFDQLLSLAVKAGLAIMEIYNSEFEVRAKEDKSPVTEADEKAEEIILEGLARLAPGIPAIGEEAYTAGKRPDISGGLFWLVDALDGTKEFVKRRGEFTVNIGLIENGSPLMGVVYAPAKDDAYWGGPGGAFMRESGSGKVRIEARIPADDGIVVVSSRSHREGEDEFLKDYSVKEEINSGSSIKFCLIAAGKADLYPRLAGTSEWDTAAAHAILSAAGGSVKTLEGEPLVYGKDNIRNPHFIAKGR